jgi:hypothetical protein
MKLSETRNSVAPTSSALRTELVEAFCSSAEDIADVLSAVSDTTQIRSGIQYLEFAMIALAAAGVQKFFLMVDQLEDLATNKSLSRAKRQREIGRIRDLMETEPYASMLHTTFTFHATAARELDTFWEQNRLPSFEDTSANQAAVVVLKGMRDDDQVEALLKAWMEPRRNGNSIPGDLVPFNRDSLTVLRQLSEGRPGILLNRAHEVFEAAAQAQVGTIDAAFARQHLTGVGPSAAGSGEPDEEPASDVIDLLA